jgi:hypothetical protein
MIGNAGWRVAICVAGMVAATDALPYPNCEDDPSAATVFIAERIANGEELDSLYDNYFVRALQKQMPRTSFVDLARSINPAASTGAPQAVQPVLTRPKIQEIDQAAVRKFTGLSGMAVGASVGILISRSAGLTELNLSLQCSDGQWKVTGISVRPPERP